ncbi:MAG TPA: aerial mycelium formation protein [Actinomycetota bacterium]|nr:aerial mycelium formation protein [Actinomycetota bacterium]
MSEGKRRIDRLLSGEFLDDLSGKSIEEVRMLRSDCAAEESLASYERRLVHGRLAILRAELERRRGGGDASSIIDALPQILADQRGPTSNRGGLPVKDVTIPFDHPSRRVTKLVSDDTLANLPTLSDDEIASHIEVLEEAEREVSNIRAQVIEILDDINREIGRRYSTGEANPSDVLTNPS